MKSVLPGSLVRWKGPLWWTKYLNQHISDNHEHFIFKVMRCSEYDNPQLKIKVLDYTYSSQPSINTALPLQQSKIKTVCYYIAVVVTFGFVWLLSRWSAKKRAIFTTNVCRLEAATHFLIHDEDTEGQTTLVNRENKYEIRLKRLCISFDYHDRIYVYIEQKEVFVPVRYEQLGMHLDKLKKDKFYPMSPVKRTELLSYYGENVMKLPVRNKIQIFIQEMLTPYQVFQTYGIMLWIYEEYYIFSFILLFYSLYTYWANADKIKNNEEKLAFESYFDVQTKVLMNDNDSVEEVEEEKHQVQLYEHKSQIMKDNFNGIDQIEIQPDLEMTVAKNVKARRSKEVKNDENILINSRNVRFIRFSSQKLVPGDIIILNELDIVPCDCILLRGEALVNERYSTGQTYLVRKEEIQNFSYSKENEKSFVLYLGTQIVKIKNEEYKLKRKSENEIQLINKYRNEKIDTLNQLVCLVTHTNYNTLRGKYLRAIRYQTKQQQTFFKETIYFIYILLIIAILVFIGYLRQVGPYTSLFAMVIMFIDMIFVAIPPTLPTVLMLGIQFVTLRLQSEGINCVFPKSSLVGGQVNTIILKGEEVFGKEYEVQSASIGIKESRGFGLNFTSFDEFQEYTDNSISYIDLSDLRRKKIQKSEFSKIGRYFISALSSCHTLQFFRKEIQGSGFEKKIFQFSKSTNISQDQFETLNYIIFVHKIIRFKQKSIKLAVVISMKQKIEDENNQRPYCQEFNQLDEINITRKNNIYRTGIEEITQENQIHQSPPQNKIIFLKGPAQKVLMNCAQHTYPEDAFDYIVDMAEKGFILFCYAMKEIDVQISDHFDYQEYINSSEFTFLGFIILEQVRSQENLAAIKILNQSDVKIIYVSEQRQLQATSKAISNGICTKNQLILCNISKNKDKVYCKGHIQWQSSTNEAIAQFITQFQEFGKHSKVSLSSPLYNELYIKRDLKNIERIFHRTVIYNKMDLKCEKNLFNQLQKRNCVSCAVGSSGNLSQSANISLELEREQSALLSNFYTKSKSLGTIVNCLKICRAGLSTNFHGFSMMILFTLTQFTTIVILNYNYQGLTSNQTLYEDLFITFPIYITINLTQPASKLSKTLPPQSFFSLKNMISMGGQLLLQFLVQLGFTFFALSYEHFQNLNNKSRQYYIQNSSFNYGSPLAQGLFILSNNIYIGIVLSTSVSKPFRKPFYTNPFYTLNIIIIWCFNTFLVVFPKLAPSDMLSKDPSEEGQLIFILALVVGNLVMVVMYMFENLLVFIWESKRNCFQKRHESELIMNEGEVIMK